MVIFYGLATILELLQSILTIALINKMNKNSKKKTAYSLIELSISILIISLLMAGVFSMINGSIVKSKIGKTTDKMNKIYNALGLYLAVNKRLPCPASTQEKINISANFGKESRGSSGNCGTTGIYNSIDSNFAWGLVPVQDLELSSEYAVDDFGNFFSYVINKKFTGDYLANPIKDASSFGTASLSNGITIVEKQTDGVTEVVLTDKSILIILSHGPNGAGAFKLDGTANFSDALLYQDDAENIITSFGNNFNNKFLISSYGADKFDDILLYKTRSDFITNFSLQSLVACFVGDIVDTGGTGNFGTNSVYAGQQLFYNAPCNVQVEAGQFKPIKTVKCNSNGEWQWIFQNCP
jgi:type II secretory pathway pseudopilin PulG